MRLKYKIKGLGVIEEAEIDIAPFTLIAGKNNTGKSFVTKSLYCILEALNDNYIANLMMKFYLDIAHNFLNFQNSISNPAKIDQEFFEFLDNYLRFLNNIITQLKNDDELNLKVFFNDFNEILNKINTYLQKREKVKKLEDVIKFIAEIKKLTEEILKIVNDPVPQIIESIYENLEINFKKNFEITNFSYIVNVNKTRSELEIENIGKITLSKKYNKVGFMLSKNGIKQIQKLRNVIYIDSPIYTKLMKALMKKSFDVVNGKEFLHDYPLYIDKLYSFLERRYIKEPDFSHLCEKIEKLINGKLKMDNNKNITYVFKDREIPLSLTAMGVTNIGVVDMLIRNNSINKGSFLIIDEPEVHLHPEWQVEFVKILYDIAKSGANVVIASHSIDIVKAVELLAKEDNKNIAVNKMPYTKEFQEKTLKDKINEILDDLSYPYYKMYMEGL